MKTTTEGYLTIKQFNDSIDVIEDRPLQGAMIQKTALGFYKISFESVKWYEESYTDVANFMRALNLLETHDIPYSFIRIGENPTDVVHNFNWTEDMPDEIASFEPIVSVNDDDWSGYEDVRDE